MKITVSKYNSDWIRQFSNIKQELTSTLSSFNPVIEHFGSTAIQNFESTPQSFNYRFN